jgi:hypothetical protein
MATLDLEVRKGSLVGADGQKSTVGAVARVRRLDKSASEQSIAVHVGGTTEVKGLEEGSYEVQLHLPSGKMLSQQIELGFDDHEQISFDASGAPARHLGWQHFSGATVSDIEEDSWPADLKSTSGPAHYKDGSDLLDIDTAPGPKLLLIEGNEIRERTVQGFDLISVWEQLAKGVKGEEKPVSMVRGFFAKRQSSDENTNRSDSWQFGFAHRLEIGKRPKRQYALVQCEGAQELVSLPLPWHVTGFNGDSSLPFVDLLVDKVAGAHVSRTNVAIRDTVFGGLIAFMNNGSLSLAGEMIRNSPDLKEQLKKALRGKNNCPLGACASAYVLLATSDLANADLGLEDADDWHEWIRNLGSDELFRWIPDVSILAARLTLYTAETESDARKAIDYLHEALRGGLPFYSLGLVWLLELIGYFKDDDHIAQVAPHVDLVSRHLDISQAFLVLKLSAKQKP